MAQSVKRPEKTQALAFVREGIGFISKKTFARNNEGFVLNKSEEMAKSAKRPKNTGLNLRPKGHRLRLKNLGVKQRRLYFK
jgi:hypothetical protein